MRITEGASTDVLLSSAVIVSYLCTDPSVSETVENTTGRNGSGSRKRLEISS